MKYYVKDMCKEFEKTDPITISQYPWDTNLLKVDESSPTLQRGRAEEFITFVYKALFVSKRARQDISPAVSFLTTCVKAPTKEDWAKL